MDINFSKEQIIEYLNNNLEKFKNFYNENAFIQKIKEFIRQIGSNGAYNAFRIYYALKEGHLSVTDKILVMAALGYFIAPIDLIPDFFGLIGLTDDAIVLGFVTKKLGERVTPEIDKKAREQVYKYFGEIELDDPVV